MNNNIQEIHHICGISVIPNSVKIQKSDISYQLSDIEKKAVISRVKYLQRTHINKKLYFYIDNPLMGIYEKLAEVYPNEYANLINCYEIIKEKIIDNIGYDVCDYIEFVNINDVLRNNIEYENSCKIACENFFIFEKTGMSVSLRYMVVDSNRLIICNNLFENNLLAMMYFDLDVVFPENIDINERNLVHSINRSDRKSILLVKNIEPNYSSSQENQMIITTLKNQCIDDVIKDVFNTCTEKLKMQKKIPLDLVFRILQKHFANKTNLENSKDPLFLLSKSINDKLNFIGDENDMEIRNRNWKQVEISNELHNEYSQCNIKMPEITQALEANHLIRGYTSRNIE